MNAGGFPANPSSKKIPIPFKDKIFCIFFGIFLALLGLEIFLRLLGVGYNLWYRPPVVPGADYRIFCVGESTTWGIGASDPRTAGYPKQLEKLLGQEFPQRRIGCFFNQMIGQNTSEILLKLPDYLDRYRPQLVIFMVGANNWWNMDRSNILLLSQTGVSRLIFRTYIFLDQFRVWKLIKNIFFNLGFYKEGWSHACPFSHLPKKERDKMSKKTNSPILGELSEYDLREMVDLCVKKRIRVIICNYPMGGGSHLDLAQENVAAKYKVPFVNNFLTFDGLKNQEMYLGSDGWHPNDRGYGVVARNLYNCILENNVIEPS